jgi:Concanavalin A-like lectin/glucanases superfamily
MASSFNGTSDKIVTANAAPLQISGKITLACWFQCHSLPPNSGTDTRLQYILSKPYDGSKEGYFLRLGNLSGTQQIEVGCFNGTSTFEAAYNFTVTVDTWYALAGLYDGSFWDLYLNGVRHAHTSSATGAVTPCSNGFCIGVGSAGSGSPAVRWLNGRVAEAAVWNTNIPPSAIGAMAAGAAPPTAHPDGLAGYWPLLGDSPAPDYSGSQIAGTLTGTTVANHPGVQSLCVVTGA